MLEVAVANCRSKTHGDDLVYGCIFCIMNNSICKK